MNNFERIRNFTENEMIDFINLIIDEGNHMLADELDYAGVKYENDNYAEVIVDEIPEELKEEAMDALEGCPVDAISIVNED